MARISITGVNQVSKAKIIRICSFLDGFLIYHRHNSPKDPLFCDTINFTTGLSAGGKFNIHVHLTSGEMYSKQVSCDSSISLESIIVDDNKVSHEHWHCVCLFENEHQTNICQGCARNRRVGWMHGLALIPFLGLPFGISAAALRWGEALSPIAHLKTMFARFSEAITATALSGLDVTMVAYVGFVVGYTVAAGSRVTTSLVTHAAERGAEEELIRLTAEGAEHIFHHGHPQFLKMYDDVMFDKEKNEAVPIKIYE